MNFLSWALVIALCVISATITIAAMLGAAHRGPVEDSGSPERPYMPAPLIRHKALKDRLDGKRSKTKSARISDARIRRMHWGDQQEVTNG